MLIRNLLTFVMLHFLSGALAQNNRGIDSLTFEYKKAYFSQELGYPVSPDGNFMLYDTLTTWLGTPYAYAGNCEKGIDCSGFVNVLYDRVFGIRLGARNSAEIYGLMQKIDKDELVEGDLVFFKIRSRSRITHVGVYLGQHKFVHASSSKGVTVSDLNEPYYKKYFAGAGRHQIVSRKLEKPNLY